MALEQRDDKTVAEELSEETGRPVEAFEPDLDEAPIPDANEQEFEVTDDA